MRPRKASIPAPLRLVSITVGAPGARRDAITMPSGSAAGRPVVAAASCKDPDFSETRHIDDRRRIVPNSGRNHSLGRAPQGNSCLLRVEQAGIRNRRDGSGGQHDGGGAGFAALGSKCLRIKAVMKVQRSTGQQPMQQRQGDASK